MDRLAYRTMTADLPHSVRCPSTGGSFSGAYVMSFDDVESAEENSASIRASYSRQGSDVGMRRGDRRSTAKGSDAAWPGCAYCQRKKTAGTCYLAAPFQPCFATSLSETTAHTHLPVLVPVSSLIPTHLPASMSNSDHGWGCNMLTTQYLRIYPSTRKGRLLLFVALHFDFFPYCR